ncbi:MAG: flavodoxin family protein [Euryarchaeota archaeon]|nr:flavodoxin family protein [Euryarchaeota archaeon]
MKGIVAYDSVHGSTKSVAEAMFEQITAEGHQAQLISVKEHANGPLEGDFIFIGSPTRAGRMTKDAKDFIESLDPSYWKGRKVVTFDTVGPMSKDVEKRKSMMESFGDKSKTAASKMKEACQDRGIPVAGTMHFAVVGMWGPIAPEAPEMAKEKTHQFLAGLK